MANFVISTPRDHALFVSPTMVSVPKSSVKTIYAHGSGMRSVVELGDGGRILVEESISDATAKIKMVWASDTNDPKRWRAGKIRLTGHDAGGLAEWLGRMSMKAAFTGLWFIAFFVAAFVGTTLARVTMIMLDAPFDIDLIHPLAAPFWMAVGGLAMRWIR